MSGLKSGDNGESTSTQIPPPWAEKLLQTDKIKIVISNATTSQKTLQLLRQQLIRGVFQKSYIERISYNSG